MNRTCLRLSVALSLWLLLPAAAKAEDAAISPEKQKLIKDYLSVARTIEHARMGFQMGFDAQIKASIARTNMTIDNNPMLTNAQREEAKAAVSDSLTRRGKRIIELLNQKISLDKAFENVFAPMLDRYFTEDELKQMLVFYRSPVGQKALDVLPKMSQEGSTKISEQLLVEARDISRQVEQEERDQAEEALRKK